jgi:predicted amino acid-binding ACT domain protein
MNHFALTIVGRDRAGIVSQVTKILFDLGCNIADSSCSILGGQFAMILILGHPEFTDRESFGEAFKPLEESDLSVSLRVLKPGGEIRSNRSQSTVPTSQGLFTGSLKSWAKRILILPTSTPSWSAAMSDLSM